MANKTPPKKETWKLPGEPEWSFGLLGIPCKHKIEFLYEGVFLKEAKEAFIVADQEEKVIHKYKEGDVPKTKNGSLRFFTKKLWSEYNRIAGTDKKLRRTLEYWIYHNPQAKTEELPILLDVLCDEKKRQHYEQRDELHSTFTKRKGNTTHR